FARNPSLEAGAFGPSNRGCRRGGGGGPPGVSPGGAARGAGAARPPHHLSFGERKRVCLAGVLACRPSVLVMDEPTANLDPRGRRRFIRLVQGLECTMLIATHDLEMVLEVCRRVVLLDGGRVVAGGPCRDLLSAVELLEQHRE